MLGQTRPIALFDAILLVFLGTASSGLASPTDNCNLDAASEASREFSYNFYKEISKSASDNGGSGNIFLAPTTVMTCLTMLHAGAGGRTREEISSGLNMPQLSDDALPCIYKVNNPTGATGEQAIHEPKDGEVVFSTVGRLFGEKSFRFRRSFVNSTRQMGQKIKKLSFSTQPEESRHRINHWVAKMTNDKIRELMGSGSIDSSTILAIISAVYFKAPWLQPFESMDTGIFTKHDNQQVRAKYMSTEGAYRWTLSASLQAELLELPFKSDSEGLISASMIILKPIKTMSELESNFNEQNVDDAVSRLLVERQQRFRVSMPKFEISLEYDLKSILSAMGMDDMFDVSRADFSLMSRSSDGLYVSAAVHKTYIKVDEIGVEAAGATGVIISARSVPRSFFLNRPFIALIYNKVSKNVLFIGKINDPTATN